MKTLVFIVIVITMVTSSNLAARQSDSAESISLTVRDVDIRHVLLVLARAAEASIIVSPHVRGAMTTELNDVPPLEAIGLVARIHGYRAARIRGVVCVGPAEDLVRLQRGDDIAVVQLRAARAADVAALVTRIERDVEILEDRRTNSIVIVPRRLD